MTGARAQLRILSRSSMEPSGSSGPLYSGGFASLVTETLGFLNSQDHLSFTGVDYLRRSILLEALANLKQNP